MIFIAFFLFVAALVCGGAALGFILAIYIFRPSHLADVIAFLDDARANELNTAVVGLVLAALLPAVAGLSYAVSGTKLFVELFGAAGTYFWAWVGAAFVTGFILGLALRREGRR